MNAEFGSWVIFLKRYLSKEHPGFIQTGESNSQASEEAASPVPAWLSVTLGKGLLGHVLLIWQMGRVQRTVVRKCRMSK